MTRNELIFELTKYELEFLASNPEHLDIVTNFFVYGGYTTYSGEKLAFLYNEKIKEKNHAQV